MCAPWVVEEAIGVDLQDKRLDKRYAEVLDQLGGHPTASIPASCGGFNEMTAAYRFFDNKKVGFGNVLEPHIQATQRRMAEQSVVILAQDTSEIDVTRPKQQMVGTGPLDGSARRGAFLHPLMAFTPEGTPLGTMYAETWTREDESDESDKPENPEEGPTDRKHTPIEDKESVRWLNTFRRAREQADELPNTHFVCVADSEADIYEVLQESQTDSKNLELIVRACQNRALCKEENQGETAARHLRQRALANPVLFTKTITVRGREKKVGCDKRGRRQPRESRIAEVEVRAVRVTLRAPWRHDRKLKDISVNVVLVTEINPPKDDTPVEWILLTTMPIETLEQVRMVIQYYCVRWMIEVFFRTLKTGCRVEDRLFEHIDRLLPCLAIYMIVTWRTLYVCRLGREFPDISCEAVFEPAEWQSVYQVVTKQPPPQTPPKLQEMVRLVARLGGYINRTRTDEPGPQTVWLGLQRAHDIATCWLTFGPGSKPG